MLRQTPTSPAVRLRAQTDRMGRRNADIRSGAASIAEYDHTEIGQLKTHATGPRPSYYVQLT